MGNFMKRRDWKLVEKDGFPECGRMVWVVVEPDQDEVEDSDPPFLVPATSQEIAPDENFGQRIRWRLGNPYSAKYGKVAPHLYQDETVVAWRYILTEEADG